MRRNNSKVAPSFAESLDMPGDASAAKPERLVAARSQHPAAAPLAPFYASIALLPPILDEADIQRLRELFGYWQHTEAMPADVSTLKSEKPEDGISARSPTRNLSGLFSKMTTANAAAVVVTPESEAAPASSAARAAR